jgi:hypothetical protein
MYTCRECEQVINQASELCPYCGADLTVTPGGAEPAKKTSLAKALLLWGTAIGFLWLMVWIALPLRMVNPMAQAEDNALEAMTNVHTALASYAQATGTFPGTLEPLGNPARAAAQFALSAGYQMQYAPGPTGSDGRVHGYTLFARPGNYGYRSFFSDETGILRATREERAATSLDPPIK